MDERVTDYTLGVDFLLECGQPKIRHKQYEFLSFRGLEKLISN